MKCMNIWKVLYNPSCLETDGPLLLSTHFSVHPLGACNSRNAITHTQHVKCTYTHSTFANVPNTQSGYSLQPQTLFASGSQKTIRQLLILSFLSTSLSLCPPCPSLTLRTPTHTETGTRTVQPCSSLS